MDSSPLYVDDSTQSALFLKIATLQAWAGQEKELAETCKEAIDYARKSTEPSDWDRVAKLCSLRPTDDKARREAAVELAKRAVDEGKGRQFHMYYQMALGMAEYRSGHFAEAATVLALAREAGKIEALVHQTSTIYLAMALFRQGKETEARDLARDVLREVKPPAEGSLDTKALRAAHDDDLILWMAHKEARALLGL